MTKKDENVDSGDKSGIEIKSRNTMGFAVSSAPIWLCKELSNEAKKYYNDVYWPVIVDWYRKAKEFENVTRGGLPSPFEERERIEIEENDRKSVPLMGGHRGE